MKAYWSRPAGTCWYRYAKPLAEPILRGLHDEVKCKFLTRAQERNVRNAIAKMETGFVEIVDMGDELMNRPLNTPSKQS